MGVAVLPAWPGRGYWQGKVGQAVRHGGHHGGPPSRGPCRRWSPRSAPSTTAHGFAVNLFVVIALAAIGAALVTGRPPLVRAAVLAAGVVLLADWVLVQDFGFFGGLGADPNSMIPTLLLLAAGTSRSPGCRTPRLRWRRRCGRRGARGDRRHLPAGGHCPRRPRRDRDRRRPDGRGVAEPDRRPHSRPGHRRVLSAAGQPSVTVPAHRPGSPHRHPGPPAQQGRTPVLPRPGVHHGLPAHRAGVQGHRGDARRAGPAYRAGSNQ